MHKGVYTILQVRIYTILSLTDKGVNLLFFSTLVESLYVFSILKLRKREDLPLYHLQIELRNVLTLSLTVWLTEDFKSTVDCGGMTEGWAHSHPARQCCMERV